jgi:YD repeat-containing protein
MAYTEEGLLTRFTNPKGHSSKMQYDELGRFFFEENPVGGGWTVARVEEDDHYEISLISALGRTTAYRVETSSGNNTKRINISPDGTQTEQVISNNGTITQTRPDGTIISQISGPDPRFGLQSPLLKELTIQLPSGLTATTNASRTVELSDPTNLTQPKTITNTTTYNGTRTHTSVYQAVDHKITSTSAEGRKTTSYLDDKGRIIKEEVPDLANVYYDYDERGRLISITEGEGEAARTATLTYDLDSGYVAKITDALDRSETFTRDKVGRILSQELPDGRQINYSFDVNGNLTSITPPSKPVHQFDYTPVDLQQQYTPPTVTGISTPQTHYSYNLDKQLLQIRRPDGQAIEFVYDEVKGRLDRIDLPNEESINYTYFEDTGKLKTIIAPDGGILSYTYDGSLVLSETWENGPITGTLTRNYNNDFRVIAVSINGNSINYQYDNDGLLTQVGDLSLHREAQNGFLIGTTLSQVITQRTLNSFGELDSETVTYQGNTLYQVVYQRDKLGRITEKVETIEGQTTTYNYHYNLVGQLVEVFQNEVSINRYGYDDNGNRITLNGVVIGSHDNQDRLIQYEENQYTYTKNGELQTKIHTATAKNDIIHV